VTWATVSFALSLGQFSTVFSEGFDGATTPSLPAGWNSSASDAQSAWVTLNSVNDTYPNSVFRRTRGTPE